jgi:hypothetical protein
LLLVAVLFAAAPRNRETLFTIIIGLTLGVAIVVGLFVKDWWRTRAEHGAALFLGLGKFRLQDLERQSRLSTAVRLSNRKLIDSWSRGWVTGTVRLDSEQLLFHPGWIAARAGVGSFQIPLDQLSRIETLPTYFGVQRGLELFLRDGSHVSCEVLGGRRALTALKRIDETTAS